MIPTFATQIGSGEAPDARQVVYLIALFAASLLFILGLRGLSHPTSARRGMVMAAVGMLIAIVGTLLHKRIVTYEWIAAGLFAGTVIGIPMGLWIPMTKMPERIALSHAFGGLAVALVGIAEHHSHHPAGFTMGAVAFECVLGAVTFTGSLMAFGKLQGFLPGRPQTFPGQNLLNVLLLAACAALVVALVVWPERAELFYTLTAIGFLLGVLLVLPIGGADMPVVICLLNSYAGLAAAATGFTLNNPVLIVCGSLDGGSGFILALIMSKAMNRSFGNVIFGAFGAEVKTVAAGGPQGTIREATVEDAALVLRYARRVVIVPGYGLAVAQAQHPAHDLGTQLQAFGAEVSYAIHPVAGRMPGHMNVLLAEANVPYEQLVEMERINPEFERTDVVLVVGANDVVNPAARTNPGSPIHGMPILEVDRAANVFVIKRSMNPGFAGIENELFFNPKTKMLFGDAKKVLSALVEEVKKAE